MSPQPMLVLPCGCVVDDMDTVWVPCPAIEVDWGCVYRAAQARLRAYSGRASLETILEDMRRHARDQRGTDLARPES